MLPRQEDSYETHAQPGASELMRAGPEWGCCTRERGQAGGLFERADKEPREDHQATAAFPSRATVRVFLPLTPTSHNILC